MLSTNVHRQDCSRPWQRKEITPGRPCVPAQSAADRVSEVAAPNAVLKAHCPAMSGSPGDDGRLGRHDARAGAPSTPGPSLRCISGLPSISLIAGKQNRGSPTEAAGMGTLFLMNGHEALAATRAEPPLAPKGAALGPIRISQRDTQAKTNSPPTSHTRSPQGRFRSHWRPALRSRASRLSFNAVRAVKPPLLAANHR